MPALHPCLLCSAMLADKMPASCKPDEAVFNRDKRICDACLSADFSAPRILPLTWIFFKFIFLLTTMVALSPAILISRHYHVRGWLFFLSTFGSAAIAGIFVATLVLAGLRISVYFKQRSYPQRHPAEARSEAERFYYLALWAALTGRKSFGRRMLRQAKQSGFSDSVRLQDSAIKQLTT